MNFEKENVVSVWVANFNSQEELNNYLAEHYSTCGDSYSNFSKDINADFIDNQFIESLHCRTSLKPTDISRFSYSDTFLNEVSIEHFGDYNSIILVYNFSFSKVTDNSKLKFLGAFHYNKH